MLKPLPQEEQNNPAQNKNKKQTNVVRLEMTIRKLENSNGKLFSAAARQLMDFIKKAENVTVQELNELIHNLQRTVLGLQKKRMQEVRKEQRKTDAKRRARTKRA